MAGQVHRMVLFASLLAASLNSWACFAPRDAKPSSEITEVRLAEKPYEPAVVYTNKKYAIYLRPADLLPVFGQPRHSITSAQDLFRGLQSKLPLQADLSVNALVASFAPRMPGTKDIGGDTPVARADRRFWESVDKRMGYAVAELLETGKAAVVDLSTGETLQTITRDEYNNVCDGGRRFIAPNGEVLLQTADWVS